MFEFYMGTKIHYGIGTRSKLQTIVSDNKWSRIGVIIDHNLANVPIIVEVLNILNIVCEDVAVGYCTISEPTYTYLDDVRKQFANKKLQAVIGIGGGSAIDTAKAMAVLVNNKNPAIAYRGFNKMTESVLPIIAIPTTAGTGSEVTPNASFIDSQEKKKLGINGEAVRPKFAILDPELTLSCPEKPTISAGIDSMVHAVEAFVAKKSNPMARLFATEGFRHVFHNLPNVIKNPMNIQNRERVMYGAFLAGIALMNSGTGPAAALSYPLGVHFGVPHGIGGGIFLPYVVQHNIANGYYGYAPLYDTIASDTVYRKGLTEKEKSELFLQSVLTVWQELSVPNDLTKIGVMSEFLNQFIKETMDLKGALDQNPLPFYETEITSVLKTLCL